MRAKFDVRTHGPSFVVACTLMVTASAASSACRYQGPNFDANTTSIQSKLTMSNKETCGHIFRTHGKMKVDNLVVSAQASHGRAGIKNSMSDPGFAYRPAPGFIGSDSFQVTLDAYNGAAEATHKMTVDVAVEVTP